ncbi:MAG: type I pantothenate kinase [Actinobacteria bacterium]|nr:type I pantothenate kinase [Actinomycetota bacterium]
MIPLIARRFLRTAHRPSVGLPHEGFCRISPTAYGDEVNQDPVPSSPSREDLDALRPVAALIAERIGGSGTAVVGMAGGVAVGKSTTAASLRSVLDLQLAHSCSIVSSDGFLLPNDTLAEQGIFHRKGFPESYDRAAIEGFVLAIRRQQFPITVPLYDHLLHDVLEASATIESTDVVLFEGVNTLGFASSLDLSIYIDAAESSMRRWYLDRVLELRRRSVEEPSAFFATFAQLSQDEFLQRAEMIWETVNLPNLLEHIEPTRDCADIVIRKGPDHAIESVLVR